MKSKLSTKKQKSWNEFQLSLNGYKTRNDMVRNNFYFYQQVEFAIIIVLIWRKANVKEAKIVDLIQKLKDQVKPLGKKIVLPEYKDERVLKATEIILKEGFVTPVLVGNPAEIAEAAKAVGVSIEGAEIIDPANYDRYQEMVDTFVELRAKKGMTPEKADATMKGDCLFFGAMLVRLGAVDGMVAGSATPTASVLRAALQVVGTKPGLKTVSSTMLMKPYPKSTKM